MTANVVDIAAEIWDELDSDSSLSVPAITYWLRNNIGQINGLISTSFSIEDAAFNISPTPDDDEKAIIKKSYMLYYYDKKIRAGLGSNAFTSVLEVNNDGASVRLVNKNEIAKTFKSIKADEIAELQNLINGYRLKRGVPVSVDGDDVVNGVLAPNNRYNRSNVLV